MSKLQDKIQKFDALFSMYYKVMLSNALRILGNQYDAEDAVQAAGVALYKHIGKIGELDSRETCSYVILTVESRALNILKQRKRRGEVPLEEDQRGVDMTFSGASPLEDAITKLTPRYRQAILLRFGMGYSIKEIAKMMNISKDAAQKLVTRARDQLKTILKEQEAAL